MAITGRHAIFPIACLALPRLRIDAFNGDKPYDQFVREQIAGDLLPYESQVSEDQQLTATDFWPWEGKTSTSDSRSASHGQHRRDIDTVSRSVRR